MSVLVVGVALMAALSPREAVAVPVDRELVQPGTPLRVMLLPLKLPGQPAPSRRRLQRTLRTLTAWMSRVSYGRLSVDAEIAPVFRVPRRDHRRGLLNPAVFQEAMRLAQARGIRFGGALPIYIARSRANIQSFTSSAHVLIQGRAWADVRVWTHELGHLLGLDHARAPTACPRPFRTPACADRPRNNFEYGDLLDMMGYGSDRLGAYALAVLGLAPVLDAPSGRARLPIRPLDRREPTLLRLRTARHDWFVDSRIRSATRNFHPVRLPRGVAISRVPPRYTPGDYLYPPTQRIPATDPEVACRGTVSCLGRQIFRPGRSLTVPGAFRLRVLRGGGPLRVETTWLDQTPPTVAVAGATVIQHFGTGPELELDLRADATGAGVAGVEIDQGGTITRVDADDAPGLAGRRGHGRVRVPLVAGAAATRVWLVDAAGNASPPVAVVPAATVPAATIASSPATGSGPATAVPLADGQSVTISGTTDPALAGQFGRFQVSAFASPEAVELPIGAGGRFSVTWTAPEAGLYILQVRVPVERLADGINFRMQTWEGHVRG